MAITTEFLTGFETGLLSLNGNGLADTIDAGVTVPAAAARNGGYGLRIAAAAASPTWRKILPTDANRKKTVHRFAFRKTAYTSGNPGLYAVLDSTLAVQLYVYTGSGGQVVVHAPAGTGDSVSGMTTALDGNWHVVELQIDSSANPTTVDWKVDGVAQTQQVGGSQATWAQSRVAHGIVSGGAHTSTFDFDDLIVGQYTNAGTDWYGDGKILAQLAGSDGTHSFTANDFSTGDAGTLRAPSYTSFSLMVDDAPPWVTARDAADNICQRVIRTTGYVEIAPAAAVPSGAANAVRALLAYSASGTAADTMGCIARNSGGASVVIWGDLPSAQGGGGGALADYSESTNFFKGAIVPVPGGGWTATEVNAVRWRLGGSDDITPLPTVQALLLEVDWPITAAASVPLAAVAGVGAATLGPTAPTQVPLGGVAGVGAAVLGVTAATRVALGAIAGLGAATLSTTAPTRVALGAVAGLGSAALGVTAPTRIPLSTVTGQGSATLSVQASGPAMLSLAAGGQGSASMTASAPTRVTLSPITGQGAATLSLKVPIRVALGQVTGQGSATLGVGVPVNRWAMIPRRATWVQTITERRTVRPVVEQQAIDDFNRVEAPLSTGWITPAFTRAAVVFDANGGQCVPRAAGYASAVRDDIDCEDMFAWATLIPTPPTGPADMYVMARVQGDQCYEIDVYRQSSTTVGVYLYYDSDATYHEIAHLDGVTAADGDAFGIRVEGDKITALHRPVGGAWTEVCSGTDTTITGSGSAGLYGSADPFGEFGVVSLPRPTDARTAVPLTDDRETRSAHLARRLVPA